MNRILADALGYLNMLLALALIGGGGYLAHEIIDPSYTIIGVAIGFLAAILACGVLALFVDMRNAIRELLEETRRTGAVSPKNYIEPRM